jgi:hypothetical protein
MHALRDGERSSCIAPAGSNVGKWIVRRNSRFLIKLAEGRQELEWLISCNSNQVGEIENGHESNLKHKGGTKL